MTIMTVSEKGCPGVGPKGSGRLVVLIFEDIPECNVGRYGLDYDLASLI
jgi:hypothetical protein